MNAEHSGRAPLIKVSLTPGSLAAIEAFFLHNGLSVSQRFLVDRLLAHRRLTTLDRIASLFNQFGMEVRIFSGTLEDLLHHPPGTLVCSGTGELIYSNNPFNLDADGAPPSSPGAPRRWLTAWIADSTAPAPMPVPMGLAPATARPTVIAVGGTRSMALPPAEGQRRAAARPVLAASGASARPAPAR